MSLPDNQEVWGEHGVDMAKFSIEVPGLTTERKDPETGVWIHEDNLDEVIPQIAEKAYRHPWLKDFIGDVIRGNRWAAAEVFFGTIAVTAAVYEFKYHGRDFKTIAHKVDNFMHPKESK